MSSQCQELERLGFDEFHGRPDVGHAVIACTIPVASRTFQPGVATAVSYWPCVVADAANFVQHEPEGRECWHRLADSADLADVRIVAARRAMESLDADLDLWEVRGQFAFADPDTTSHRWHAQRSRLRLSSLRYEIGRISREFSDVEELNEIAKELRARVSNAYGLLAEMATSSLADKGDIEASARENLNLLLSIVTTIVLAPGVVISFTSALHATTNAMTLLLSCASASLVSASLIVGFSGVRIRLTSAETRWAYAVVMAVLAVAGVAVATWPRIGYRGELTTVLGATVMIGVVAGVPWGAKRGAEPAPDHWRAIWDSIRNDRVEYWTRFED